MTKLIIILALVLNGCSNTRTPKFKVGDCLVEELGGWE